MIRADVFLWILVFIFGWIGASRGWVREVIVTFALLFALFIYSQFNTQIRAIPFGADNAQGRFIMRSAPLLFIAFFGYLGPAVVRNRFDQNFRGKIEQNILSFLVGAFNGYIIFSTIMFFANDTGLLTDPALNPAGNAIFTAPAGGWGAFWFIQNSAYTVFAGTTLLVILVMVFLFVIVVLI